MEIATSDITNILNLEEEAPYRRTALSKSRAKRETHRTQLTVFTQSSAGWLDSYSPHRSEPK